VIIIVIIIAIIVVIVITIINCLADIVRSSLYMTMYSAPVHVMAQVTIGGLLYYAYPYLVLFLYLAILTLTLLSVKARMLVLNVQSCIVCCFILCAYCCAFVRGVISVIHNSVTFFTTHDHFFAEAAASCGNRHHILHPCPGTLVMMSPCSLLTCDHAERYRQLCRS
jgi:hypothetical protein